MSFASTLPVAFVPALPLFVPPASVAEPVSSTVTSASLSGVTATVAVAKLLRLLCAEPSFTW
jgi:hypothetical protein